jgi:predicted CXXCH cytochrome family protein
MRHCRIHLIFGVILIGTAFSGARAISEDQCFDCHEALEDTTAILFVRDIHRARGITCAGCHGGDAASEDMEEAMSEAAGFTGVPKGDDISRVCATCHSNAAVMITDYSSSLPMDQMELLSASVHGELSTTGKDRIAQCTSCHGAHGISTKTNRASLVNALNIPHTCTQCHSDAAYMRSYDPALPVDQLPKYRTSIHGKRNAGGDTKVAECADCHGNVKSRVYATNIPGVCAECHADATYMKGYGVGSDQLEKYSASVHGKALLEDNDLGAPACNNCHGNHGAIPPGVASISKVCGTCHALNAELFSKSPHNEAFDSQGLPECETCHGYHDIVAATDKLLGVGEDAVCSWCHGDEPDSKGYRIASSMRQLIDSLESVEADAAQRVFEAEQKGMEIGEAKFQLRSVRQSRFEARTKVHSFDYEQFHEVVDGGIKVGGGVVAEATQAIDEYYYRRWGLGIASLIMTTLAISMFIVIRRIESRQKAQQ